MEDYYLKANCLYHDKNYKEAIKHYSKVSKEDTRYNNSLFNKGVCYLKLNKFKTAIDIFKKVIENNNMHVKAIYNCGWCYQALSNYKKALTYYKSAYALDNNDIDCKEIVVDLENYLINKVR